MVNTEPLPRASNPPPYYNILNIVVNTERICCRHFFKLHYNILNIVVNTEPKQHLYLMSDNYNILNIVVNTERIC